MRYFDVIAPTLMGTENVLSCVHLVHYLPHVRRLTSNLLLIAGLEMMACT